jgi:hypothetical protein
MLENGATRLVKTTTLTYLKDQIVTLTFLYLGDFVKRASKLMSENDYRTFENILLDNPTAGTVVKHSGGLRKVRVASVGAGKSGGFRIVYLLRTPFVFVLWVYTKSEKSDLTDQEWRVLAQIAQELK